jgi:hypothetical protein
MRRFSLLLCLLVVAALGWIIGSAEAPTTTQQRDAVLPKMHFTLEAVNTGFKDTSVATGIRSSDADWISYELLPTVIEAYPRSTNAILSRSESTSGIRTHRERCWQGESKIPALPQIGSDRPRRPYL